VQFAVIEALTSIRDESSVGAMINALGQASDLVASTLVDAIGEMGNIKAVPLLLKRLQSSPTALRSKIARAVICIMGEHSLSLIGAKECEFLRSSLICALEDEDPQIQDAAVKGLAALGGQGTTSSILALAMRLDAERDEERIANAVKALSKLADVPELEKTVLAGNEQATRIALSVLLQVDEARGVALMVDIFWQQSRDVQRDMITALADCAGSEYQDFFLDTLERHDDGGILRGALLFLSRHSDADLVFDKVIPLLSHPYDDVRQAALEACILLHSAAVEQHFRQMASDPDPLQRAMGVYGLGFFDLSHSVNELKAALGDESPDVRKVAAGAFGQHFPIRAEYLPLLEETANDDHWEVRMAVFGTLGRCFEKSFIPYFLKGLNDEEPWVRVRCVECLGEHKVSQAVEPLLRLLHEDNSLIVLKAIEALGKIGGEAAFRALLPVLEHRDRDIQTAAEQALSAIHSQAGE
jgi:HEAT repeat protein